MQKSNVTPPATEKLEDKQNVSEACVSPGAIDFYLYVSFSFFPSLSERALQI